MTNEREHRIEYQIHTKLYMWFIHASTPTTLTFMPYFSYICAFFHTVFLSAFSFLLKNSKKIIICIIHAKNTHNSHQQPFIWSSFDSSTFLSFAIELIRSYCAFGTFQICNYWYLLCAAFFIFVLELWDTFFLFRQIVFTTQFVNEAWQKHVDVVECSENALCLLNGKLKCDIVSDIPLMARTRTISQPRRLSTISWAFL